MDITTIYEPCELIDRDLQPQVKLSLIKSTDSLVPSYLTLSANDKTPVDQVQTPDC